MENFLSDTLIAVDIVVMIDDFIVLIERIKKPYGWALPGGFVEYGESFEDCAIRETFEEIGVIVKLKEQFHVYSNCQRDCRRHVVSVVFIAEYTGIIDLNVNDDAKFIDLFNYKNVPNVIMFDHTQILLDYFNYVDGMKKIEIFKRHL